MTLTVAVQMDPIEGINPVGDSTFALMLEGQARGHSLLYYTPDTLALRDNRLFARIAPVTVMDARRNCLYVSDSHDFHAAGPGVWRFDLETGAGQPLCNLVMTGLLSSGVEGKDRVRYEGKTWISHRRSPPRCPRLPAPTSSPLPTGQPARRPL